MQFLVIGARKALEGSLRCMGERESTAEDEGEKRIYETALKNCIFPNLDFLVVS